jgi:hypothetical protein
LVPRGGRLGKWGGPPPPPGKAHNSWCMYKTALDYQFNPTVSIIPMVNNI